MTKDDLKYFLPYTGSLLILLGVVKLGIYYWLFGINILLYLDLTEILILFIQDMFALAIPFLIINVVAFVFIPKKEELQVAEEMRASLEEKRFIKRLKIYSKNSIVDIVTFSVIWALGALLLFLIKRFNVWPFIEIFLLVFGVFLLKVFILETRRQYYIKFEKYPKLIYSHFFIVFCTFLILTIRSAFQEYDLTKNKKLYVGTQILVESGTITSDSTSYYIGKTKNFVFFFDEINKVCDIYPMSEIKKIRMKKNGR